MFEKVTIITQIWHRAKFYFTSMSNAPCLNQWYIPNMTNNLRYHNQHSKYIEQIAIMTQIWHRAKFYFTCISSPWCMITVPNMKKIHPGIMEECVRTDWQTGPLSHHVIQISNVPVDVYFINKTTSLLIFTHLFLSIRVWETQGC